MKFVVRCILVTFVLLLSGFGYIAAQSVQEENGPAPEAGLATAAAVETTLPAHPHSLVLTPVASALKKGIPSLEVRESEDKEDESISVKKYLKGSAYLVALFCALTLSSLFRYLHTCVASRTHVASFSFGRRYLLLRVIRV
ncbi:hypothetical protein SAMN05421823_104539 [Catalinimonas alkaloidigena]|uniref:Uncharacterized protein n=1 Tax=Catalinimonas alkaloidigena TaxID=1075417 RepID=A0A1G9HTW0_9BACT|nr:hypothetical protein [Catalinimonas alkaloidigena]SDL16390.1 hypothetical protein SAMN05421823_104539 [Catalinimonas alkaloidigena]